MGVCHLVIGLLLALGVSGRGTSVLEQGTCAPETITVFKTITPTPFTNGTSTSAIAHHTGHDKGASYPFKGITTSEVTVTEVGSTFTSWVTIASVSTSTSYGTTVASTETVVPIPRSTSSAFSTLIPTGSMGLSYTGPGTTGGTGTGFSTSDLAVQSSSTSSIVGYPFTIESTSASMSLSTPTPKVIFPNSTSSSDETASSNAFTDITPISVPQTSTYPGSGSVSIMITNSSSPAVVRSSTGSSSSSSEFTYPANNLTSAAIMTSTSTSIGTPFTTTTSTSEVGTSSAAAIISTGVLSEASDGQPEATQSATTAPSSVSTSSSSYEVTYPAPGGLSSTTTDISSSASITISTSVVTSLLSAWSSYPASVNASTGIIVNSISPSTSVLTWPTSSVVPKYTNASSSAIAQLSTTSSLSVSSATYPASDNVSSIAISTSGTSVTSSASVPTYPAPDVSTLTTDSTNNAGATTQSSRTSSTQSSASSLLSSSSTSSSSSALIPSASVTSPASTSRPPKPIQPVSLEGTTSSSSYSTYSELDPKKRLSRTWNIGSSPFSLTATPLSVPSGDAVERRQVGSIVIATINSIVESWTNSYGGPTQNAATSSTLSSSASISTSDGTPVATTTTTDLSMGTSIVVPTIPTSAVATESAASSSPFPSSVTINWNSTSGLTTFQTVSGTSGMSTYTIISSTQTAAVSSTPEAACSGRDSGNFTIGFDDLGEFSAPLNDTSTWPMVDNAYYHLMWANGWEYGPKPAVPFVPASQPHLGFFNVDVKGSNNVTAKPNPDQEFNGMISAGGLYHDTSFWFDANAVWLGCKNPGPNNCEWVVNGWKIDSITGKWNIEAQMSFSTPPCPQMAECLLSPVQFTADFRNLTALQFVATIPPNKTKVSYYMDDLHMVWSNKSCAATQERQKAGPDVTL